VKHNRRVRFVGGGHLSPESAILEWDRRKALWDVEDGVSAPPPGPVSAPPAPPALAVADLGDIFLTSKEAQVSEGMGRRTFTEYDEAVKDFAAVVGPDKPIADLAPADFQRHRLYLVGRFGVHRRKKHMILIRGMFKWGTLNDHLPKLPRYGTEYRLPSKSDLRKAEGARRREHGELAFSAADVGALLAAADGATMRAMILLALNCGFGQEDVSSLPTRVLDLAAGVIDDYREKTGIRRRAFLWPETVKAVRAAVAVRPDPCRPDLAALVFLTRWGNQYVEDVTSEGADGAVRTHHKDALGMQFLNLCRRANAYRRGRNFYSLRRTFRTAADDLNDQRAVALVMGHEVGDVADLYVESVADVRLRKIADHVRRRVLLPALKAEARQRRKLAIERKAGRKPDRRAG
jgi:hypothetical protein